MKNKVFLQLKEYLRPFGISRFYTDNAGVYNRHLAPDHHEVGKQHTQKIERKHLTLRTRIKRLTRKTICFSKSILMHDIVLGLFVNRYEFALPILEIASTNLEHHLIDQGESPKYIQAQLGHASIQVTMDRYGHLLPDVNQQAARRLEDNLFGTSDRKPSEKPTFSLSLLVATP